MKKLIVILFLTLFNTSAYASETMIIKQYSQTHTPYDEKKTIKYLGVSIRNTDTLRIEYLCNEGRLRVVYKRIRGDDHPTYIKSDQTSVLCYKT